MTREQEMLIEAFPFLGYARCDICSKALWLVCPKPNYKRPHSVIVCGECRRDIRDGVRRIR